MENKEQNVNQNENNKAAEPKKENFFKRTWKKVPKPLKVIIIGAGAVGATMVAGKVINPDKGKDYFPEEDYGTYPYGEEPVDPNVGT